MEHNAGRKLELNTPYGVAVERLNGGEPIISPTMNWWETGVTFNAAAVYLGRQPENEHIIRTLLPMLPADDARLREGVVAIHYRARPEQDPNTPFGRSFIGLAVFTPTLELIYRYQEPVMRPSADPQGIDSLGVEDPRITRLGEPFYMVYCGVQPDPAHTWKANLCLATSSDLLNWQKKGVISGDPSQYNNKDGVLFAEPIHGNFYLLHRPFDEHFPREAIAIYLAVSKSLEGPWQEAGELLRAFPNPKMHRSWVGAGSVPI